ncbi:hypothetical protein NP233_g9094 [Leucocoprinus birnbaumii]|uniref:Fungal-type protein kinase domain-containing protein n=1 Tax=Leucocoprinus birnbaumii TaxID=56174 RepID=A0AAD5VL31_9AGAR|nr:hypothetical protein NP233_g9094 [Leucocoprinus birnbaumii]
MSTGHPTRTRNLLIQKLADANRAYKELAEETRGRWVGPMPIELFFEKFLPGQSLIPSRNHGNNLFSNIPSYGRQVAMYQPLVNALNSLKLAKLQFVDTSNARVEYSQGNKLWRPDISTYTSEECDWMPSGAEKVDTDYGTFKIPATLRFARIILPFELKRGGTDPFSDSPVAPRPGDEEHEFEKHDSESSIIRGQIAAILNEVLAHRSRTHTFSIYMNGSIVRFLRADRAGILVSRALNYREEPGPFIAFLEALSMFSTEKDCHHLGIDATADWSSDNVLNLLEIPEFHGNLNVSKLPQPDRLTGRAHRLVEATTEEAGTGNTYRVKDGWVWIDDPASNQVPEIATLQKLEADGIQLVPRFVAGGYTQGQWHTTQTQDYANAVWRACSASTREGGIDGYRHYRFIQTSTGKPLKEFSNAEEFVQAITDVLETLSSVKDKCNLMHGNVNDNNITINEEGRGVLIDWEFARRVGDIDSGKYPLVTGTWYFMSLRLLNWSTQIQGHCVSDDAESVFWVLLYLSLNFLPNNMEGPATVKAICSAFSERTYSIGVDRDTGGLLKSNFITGALTPGITMDFTGQARFTEIVSNLSRLLVIYFHDVKYWNWDKDDLDSTPFESTLLSERLCTDFINKLQDISRIQPSALPVFSDSPQRRDAKGGLIDRYFNEQKILGKRGRDEEDKDESQSSRKSRSSTTRSKAPIASRSSAVPGGSRGSGGSRR